MPHNHQGVCFCPTPACAVVVKLWVLNMMSLFSHVTSVVRQNPWEPISPPSSPIWRHIWRVLLCKWVAHSWYKRHHSNLTATQPFIFRHFAFCDFVFTFCMAITISGRDIINLCHFWQAYWNHEATLLTSKEDLEVKVLITKKKTIMTSLSWC